MLLRHATLPVAEDPGPSPGPWSPPGDPIIWLNSENAVSSGGTWLDATENGNDVDLNAGLVVTEGTGLVVTSPNFGPMSASGPWPTQPGPGVGHSMAFWIRPTSMYASGYTYIFGAGRNSRYLLFSLNAALTASTLYFHGGGTTDYLANWGADFTDNDWHHVAMTGYWGDDAGQTNKEGRLYIDGVDVCDEYSITFSVGSNTLQDPVKFGLNSNVTDVVLDFDDGMYWGDKILTLAEVTDIMNNSPHSKVA